MKYGSKQVTLGEVMGRRGKYLLWRGTDCEYIQPCAPRHSALAVCWDMPAFLHGFAFSQFRSIIRVGFFSYHKSSVIGYSLVFRNRRVSPVDDSNHNNGDCVFG